MKKYIKPQLNVIVMSMETPLLASSDPTITYDPNKVQTGNAYEEALGKTTVSGSIWDIDDEEDK